MTILEYLGLSVSGIVDVVVDVEVLVVVEVVLVVDVVVEVVVVDVDVVVEVVTPQPQLTEQAGSLSKEQSVLTQSEPSHSQQYCGSQVCWL